MKQLPVTVIIAAYNHEEYVTESILSVINQTYADIELIIIDDGSKDNTLDKIKKVINLYPSRNIKLITQDNLGVSKTLNKGIRLAKGDYIAFLASDDAYLPERIEEGVKVLSCSSEDIGAVYSDGFIINAFGQKMQMYSDKCLVPTGRNVYKELLIGNWIAAVSVLYRKTALYDCGLFDENIEIEDYDMLLRFSKKYKMLYIPKPLFLYRWHNLNFSHNIARMNRATNQILEKNRDLFKYRKFCSAVVVKDIRGIITNMNILNIELLLYNLRRKVQKKRDKKY